MILKHCDFSLICVLLPLKNEQGKFSVLLAFHKFWFEVRIHYKRNLHLQKCRIFIVAQKCNRSSDALSLFHPLKTLDETKGCENGFRFVALSNFSTFPIFRKKLQFSWIELTKLKGNLCWIFRSFLRLLEVNFEIILFWSVLFWFAT